MVPTAWQDEALARDGVSREVPCPALKGDNSFGGVHFSFAYHRIFFSATFIGENNCVLEFNIHIRIVGNTKLSDQATLELSTALVKKFIWFGDFPGGPVVKGASLIAQLVKNPPAMQETLV